MKKKYGNVTPHENGGNANDQQIAITGDGHSISYSDLSEIIGVRMEEILRLVMLELPQKDYERLIPAGLVITGGGANLPGLAELGQKITRMPVRVGRPMRLDGVSDPLDDPAYATAVGLLLWKMKNKSTASAEAKQGGFSRLISKMFRLFR
jgi:cell division protein FtsA